MRETATVLEAEGLISVRHRGRHSPRELATCRLLAFLSVRRVGTIAVRSSTGDSATLVSCVSGSYGCVHHRGSRPRLPSSPADHGEKGLSTARLKGPSTASGEVLRPAGTRLDPKMLVHADQVYCEA